MNGHAASLATRQAEQPPLRQLALFADLDETALGRLSAAARYHNYARGALLPSVLPDSIVAVTSGRLRLYYPAADGREVTLSIVFTGDLLGGSSALTDGAARTCIEALEDGTAVYIIPIAHLTCLIECQPLVVRLMDHLRGQVAEAHERIVEAALYDVKARLAHTLARLARREDGRMVRETHAHLATLIGTRPEDVTRALHYFAALRLIAMQPHRHGITVLDPDALAAF